MMRFLISVGIGMLLWLPTQGQKLAGQASDIRKARIKKIDLDRGVLTLTVEGNDQDFLLTPQTVVAGAAGKDLKERLQGLKEGTEVFFKTGRKDDKDYLLGLRPVVDSVGGTISKADLSKLTPLPELGTGKYQGFPGGLYPDGKNERPAAHEALGLALAKQIQPLGLDGKPSPDGKIVLLSIGMSNTTQEFAAFQRLADADRDKNPKLVMVDGAQGGMTANRIMDPEDKGNGTRFWTVVDRRLQTAGVNRDQVQAAWIKQADPQPTQGFPKYAQTLQGELRQIVQLMHRRFPNLKLVYLSSRTYGGYARRSEEHTSELQSRR